ncbi:glycosyltransferase involved in cell wall biosynthesis [Gillisia sp. Hel_I_86]|uniref:glycosyltransferase family 4 protein n=1 Tax=Gillisia sp. Hel_I_86 TaxID=1249981 RepID=UPI00119BBDE8|nr:glycosyltransferase family 1 protein [Gillisia sp. Hel_I_86]TVZ26043.1 glycosyltransferase involved in cell wall biosynthesis [Gillisia sp. Hel_I_86]
MVRFSIDATNIKAGGGLTHLKQLVENNSVKNDSIELIGGIWLKDIIDQDNVSKIIFKNDFKNIVTQEYFKKFKLEDFLKRSDIAFIPGGTFSSKKVDYVSMSQNMLVFENLERNRFPISITWLRYILLEKLQIKSFINAKGIIYISEYAKNFIENKYPILREKKSIVIYHGISDDFRQEPKEQLPLSQYTEDKPFKLTYISIVNFYKHQWNVIEAIKKLKKDDFNIELNIIGPIYEPVREKFEKSLEGTETYVNYKGKVPYLEISNTYKSSDLFIFASTCENMPNILVEAMSAGLPILSSNYGPMPEILKDAGVYMDPTDVDSIYSNLKKMILDENLRAQVAKKAYTYSQDFSWEKTSKETFDFIKEVGQENKFK